MLTDLDVQFMTLFRRLSGPQQKVVTLAVVLAACANELDQKKEKTNERI